MAYEKLKEINIKIRTYYYLEDLIKINDFDFENNVWDENSNQDVFICYLGYKIPYNVKTLHIGAAARMKVLRGKNNLIFNKIESQLQKNHNFWNRAKWKKWILKEMNTSRFLLVKKMITVWWKI